MRYPPSWTAMPVSGRHCDCKRGPRSRSSYWVSFVTESQSPGIAALYEAWPESQLPHFDVLAVTEETAVSYAALRVALKRSGRPIPANDAWIAALALRPQC